MAKNKFFSSNSGRSGLPENVIMKDYPKSAYMSYPELDDTIRVIDNQMSKDVNGPKHKKGSMPEKF